MEQDKETFHGTTILSVRRGNEVCIGGDGQITLGHVVFKSTARKIRKLYKNQIIVGFAGSLADALSLSDKFEEKLEKHQGHLVRSAVDLAKDWRTDKILRKLEAMMIAVNTESSLIISGNGDIIEPENGIAAVGSGGNYAYSAAIALLQNTELSASEIVKKSLSIAGDLCIYTNHHHTIETLTLDINKLSETVK